MFLASWRVDRVGVVLPGGDLERRSASAWRNKSALLPLPVRRRRVVGSVVWPADGSCLFGAPRSADLRGFASELFADLLSPAGRGGEGRRSLVWQLCFVLVFVVFFGGSPLSGRGGKGRDPLEVLLVRLVVLLAGGCCCSCCSSVAPCGRRGHRRGHRGLCRAKVLCRAPYRFIAVWASLPCRPVVPWFPLCRQ